MSDNEYFIESEEEIVAKYVEEEEDPLDAFMVTLEQQELKSTKPLERTDFEQEDEYLQELLELAEKKKEIVQINHDEYQNSDDEVYAYESGYLRIKVEPLPLIDRASIHYLPFERNFYKEHDAISKLTKAQVDTLRKEWNMQVRGVDVPNPIVSFAHFGFDDTLISSIIKAGYNEPTPIQKQSMPCALSGRDVVSIAKTGSGKTFAYLIPLIVHVSNQSPVTKKQGPIAVILVPTRELAQQVFKETKRFANIHGIRAAVLVGGNNKQDQYKYLMNGVEVVISTPGRLIDLIKMEATNLHRVTLLVCDEADRLLDMGFEEQVLSICKNMRPDRQTIFFSATFKKRVEHLIDQIMMDPIRISIGHSKAANVDIEQIVHVVANEEDKHEWLFNKIVELGLEGNVLIFVAKRSSVNGLVENLKEVGQQAWGVHGDMHQLEREKALNAYRNTLKGGVLVATDIAARGLDIRHIKTVVNFDIAKDIEAHIHRVGRTGRASEKGHAYTLILPTQSSFAVDLCKSLNDPPDALVELAQKSPRYVVGKKRTSKVQTALNGNFVNFVPETSVEHAHKKGRWDEEI